MKKIIIGCVIFIVSFGVYLSCLCPTITSGDSGELAGLGPTLGIGHSPGYPLYSIVGKILAFLLPYANPAYRMNILSAVFMSLSAVIIYFIMLNLTEDIITSLIAGLVYSFSSSVWLMGIVSEVFGISSFFSAIVIFILMNKEITSKKLYLLSLFFGLGIASHYNIVFLIPGMLYWLVINRNKMKFESLTVSSFFFLLGISVLLYLPLRSIRQPLYDWEDPQTLGRFFQVIARLRYGSFSLAQGGFPLLDMRMLINKITFFFSTLIEDVSVVGFVIGLIGTLYLVAKRQFKNNIIILWIMLLAIGPVFIIVANVTIDKATGELLRRFFYLPILIWSIIFGLGLHSLTQKAHLIRYVCLFLPIYILLQNYDHISHRREFLFYDYGKNILRTLPKNGLLFSDRADEMEFALSYLLYAERRRKDITFFDCNAGVSRSIYGDDYYRIWGKKRLQRRNIVEKQIIESTDREVFYSTFLPQQTDISKYPYGLLYTVKPRKDLFYCDSIYSLRPVRQDEKRIRSMFLSHFDLVGNYFLTMDMVNKAEKYYRFSSAYTEDRNWFLEIGYHYYQKGNFDRAEQYYRKALEFDPDWSEVLCNLGVLYEKKGKLNQAIEWYNKAIVADPGHINSYYNLGVVCWNLGHWEKVIENFQKVLKLDPNYKNVDRFLNIARKKLK